MGDALVARLYAPPTDMGWMNLGCTKPNSPRRDDRFRGVTEGFIVRQVIKLFEGILVWRDTH